MDVFVNELENAFGEPITGIITALRTASPDTPTSTSAIPKNVSSSSIATASTIAISSDIPIDTTIVTEDNTTIDTNIDTNPDITIDPTNTTDFPTIRTTDSSALPSAFVSTSDDIEEAASLRQWLKEYDNYSSIQNDLLEICQKYSNTRIQKNEELKQVVAEVFMGLLDLCKQYTTLS
jgi:hypothetical protein